MLKSDFDSAATPPPAPAKKEGGWPAWQIAAVAVGGGVGLILILWIAYYSFYKKDKYDDDSESEDESADGTRKKPKTAWVPVFLGNRYIPAW